MNKHTFVLSIVLTLAILTLSGCGLLFSQTEYDDQVLLEEEEKEAPVAKQCPGLPPLGTPVPVCPPCAKAPEVKAPVVPAPKAASLPEAATKTEAKSLTKWQRYFVQRALEREVKIEACKYDLDMTGKNIGPYAQRLSKPERHSFYFTDKDTQRNIYCLLDEKCLQEVKSSKSPANTGKCVMSNRCCDITVKLNIDSLRK